MQEFERRSRNKSTTQDLQDGNYFDYHDRETHKSYKVATSLEPDHTLIKQALEYGYARVARVHREYVQSKRQARQPIMQISPCEILDDYFDLEVTMEGLQSYY